MEDTADNVVAEAAEAPTEAHAEAPQNEDEQGEPGHVDEEVSGEESAPAEEPVIESSESEEPISEARDEANSAPEETEVGPE